MKGPNYREPVSLDFDLAHRTILDNLGKCINDLMTGVRRKSCH